MLQKWCVEIGLGAGYAVGYVTHITVLKHGKQKRKNEQCGDAEVGRSEGITCLPHTYLRIFRASIS